MTMQGVWNEILVVYGPLGMGWVAALALAWYVFKQHREHREDYMRLVNKLQGALENNTKAMTTLSVRLEERRDGKK